MCPAVTTGRVLGGAVVGAIVRHAGAIVRLGQRGAGGACGRPAPRVARVLRAPGRGWGVGWAVAGRMWAHAVSGRDKRGPPVSPRCRRRGISRWNSSAGSIRGASAREVPAPPSARDVQAGPAQGPAATSAALPCGRGCRGRGISRRNSSAGSIRGASAREVPAPPSARDVQAGPAQGPAATSAALPCGRGCRGRGISRRNSSEVKSRIPKPTAGAWPDYVAHKKIKRESACMEGGGGTVVGADVPGGPTPARNAVGRLTAWARAGARDARPYQCRGIPLCATPGPLCVTSGPLCTRANQRGRSVRTSRAEGDADTSHAGGAFMCGSYRNTKPKRLGNASVWC